MAIYHINPATGNPGVCRADPSKPKARGCDFELGADQHYSSPEAARTAFEKSMTEEGATASAPVDKKILRLQALATVPKNQSFSEPVFFSTEEAVGAQYKLNDELSDEKKEADEWIDLSGAYRKPGRRWLKFVGSVYETSKRAEELNAERYGAALHDEVAHDTRPMNELVGSGIIKESSPKTRLNDSQYNTAKGLGLLPSSLQREVYQQPASFLRILADAPGGKGNVKALVQLSNELRKLDPKWVPTVGEIPPARIERRRSEEGVPQMQKIGPYGYGLLQTYARKRFGERAPEFWSGVVSNSVNYPKISDYMRALKEFS